MTEPLLTVENLKVQFRARGRLLRPAILKAVDDVSFDIDRGETLAVVGESGSGKSTLARAILRLIEPTEGRVLWLGADIAEMAQRTLRARRRDVQIIFQDPLASLDPRMTAGDIIAEPLTTLRPKPTSSERRALVAEIMEKVGLPPALINRYPHEFSGGQCQRIGIARAMILMPRLVICDEPVSALDVSVRAQIINLLKDLQRDFGMSLLFISHDLAVVRHIAARVLVLYLGRVMEMSGRDLLFDAPLHPYTKALLDSVLTIELDGRSVRNRLRGEIPSPLNPPSGCVFRTRCPLASEVCTREVPLLRELRPGQSVACHHAAL